MALLSVWIPIQHSMHVDPNTSDGFEQMVSCGSCRPLVVRIVYSLYYRGRKQSQPIQDKAGLCAVLREIICPPRENRRGIILSRICLSHDASP